VAVATVSRRTTAGAGADDLYVGVGFFHERGVRRVV
jgi:hypothetical protein